MRGALDYNVGWSIEVGAWQRYLRPIEENFRFLLRVKFLAKTTEIRGNPRKSTEKHAQAGPGELEILNSFCR